jgi:transposase-like protein
LSCNCHAKRQTRWDGFDEAILALYALWMSNAQHSISKIGRVNPSDLKPIYQAVVETEEFQTIEEFQLEWDKLYPMVAESWHANWSRVRPDMNRRRRFAAWFIRPMLLSR